MKRVLVVNGPNLNLLGSREPEIYGTTTLADLESTVTSWGASRDIEVETRQSNSEAEIVDIVHSATVDGIIINPGALSHTSRALADAIGGIDTPVVEVHISNVKDREPWRSESVVSEVCVASIYGRDLVGYRDALFHLINRAAMPFETIRYGPADDNVIDVRGSGETLAVLVHGGIWRQEFLRDTMESIAVDLSQSGLTTWNIEYRRLGTGGGWPGSGHDVLTALDHIQNASQRFQRVIVVGHSAGSYLSVWAAPRSRTPVDLSIQIAGAFDLTAGAAAEMIGSPDCQTMIDMGAPHQVEPNGVETLLFHGSKDTISDVSQSVDLAGRSTAELVQTGSGHFEWLDPAKEEWAMVKQRILEGAIIG